MKRTPKTFISSFLELVPKLYLPLILLLALAYAWSPLDGGSDFWAHAAVGRWIADNGHAPHRTLFLWTTNAPWTAHSWMSQLLFYWLLKYVGARGVVIWCAAMVVLVFCLLWLLLRSCSRFHSWTPLVFGVAVWSSAPRFMARPELFSAFFLVLLLAFLIAWSRGRFDDWLADRGLLDKALVGIPLFVIFFLWTNLHGMVGYGLAVLLLTLLCDLGQAICGHDKVQSPARRRVRVLGVITLLCFGAVLINPFGAEYFRVFTESAGTTFRYIEEWRSPLQGTEMRIYLISEGLLLIVALAAWWANGQRRWSHLLWMVLATATLLRSRRMLWIASILYLCVIIYNAQYLNSDSLWRKWRKLSRGDARAPIPDAMRLTARCGAALCLLAWLIAAVSMHKPAQRGAWNTWARKIPDGAARYVLAIRPRHLLTDYETSSYFQWRLNGALPDKKISNTKGRLPLYIDLLNAYPDSLMLEYLSIIAADPAGLNKLKSRRIDCVVLRKAHWKAPLVAYLSRPRSGWKNSYADKVSKVWIRR